MGEEGPRWGDSEWKDDDKVRVLQGEAMEPWKTWDACCGPWKFPNGLMQFLIDAGFKCPTPIQAYTWPALMDNRDVIGVAKTGSGKTLGYLLPGYIKVKREEMNGSFSCDHTTGPAMLVMAPTRELCQQIFEESDRFGKPAGIKTAQVFGGAPRSQQMRSLWDGPHCLVATPGRLADFLRDGSCKLGKCLYLVLDEADRMLDMGFEPQITDILQYLPQVGSTDSATTNADITQHVIIVNGEGDKMKFLEERIFPDLQKSGGSALIFVKTKRAAANLYTTLARAGAPIVCLHGDMQQQERDHALWAFKQGKAKVLAATDVAQRGLDIKNVHCVINFDPPANMEDYVHRIGRTGRAGEKGDAFTCLYEHEWQPAQAIEKVMKKSGQAVPDNLKRILDRGSGGGGGFSSWGGGGGGCTGEWGGRYASGGRG